MFWTPDRIVTFHELVHAGIWSYLVVIGLLVVLSGLVKLRRYLSPARCCFWCGCELDTTYGLDEKACRRCDRSLASDPLHPRT